MTCVVGLVHGGKVHLGGDSAASYESDGPCTLALRPESKVFALQHGMVAGFAGSYRMGQLLRYHLELPPPPAVASEEWVVKTFVVELMAVLRDNGMKREMPGDVLLGIKDSLFVIGEDYNVGTCAYTAIGSGAPIALGSLFASSTMKVPVLRVQTALQAAEAFCTGVRGPFSLVRT
jgi:ATP-dependent protease HslVU (ClpYQ) peptidase subunit